MQVLATCIAMLLVFLMLFAVTRAVDDFDVTIELQPGETKQLKTKNFPRPDPVGFNFSWKIDSTDYNSRIKLSCPTFKQHACTGWFTIYRSYDPKSHCNEKRFIEYSTGNIMDVFYYTNASNKLPVDPPECFVSVEKQISLVTTTERFPLPPEFPQCDYNITLQKDQFYEIKTPRNVPCRWWANSPTNTRIHVVCPRLYQMEDACTGLFTVKRFQEPLSYCNNKRFSEYSDTNEMVLEFKTIQTNGDFANFNCYLSVENQTDACHCGRRNTARSLNGEDAGVNEFPMMAGLRPITHIEYFCGATIISEWYALTAANCVNEREAKDIALVAGEHDRSREDDTWSTELYQIDRITVHPNYTITKIRGFVENDIAIVHVVTHIKFNSKVGPACLPFSRKNDAFIGKDVVSLGWGRTGRNYTSSRILQKMKGFVWSDHECLKLFDEFPLKPYQLCVTNENGGTCRGDAGGPVLLTEVIDEEPGKLYLVGIHSTDRLCSVPGKPSIKTRVTSYLDWIEQNTPGAMFCKE